MTGDRILNLLMSRLGRRTEAWLREICLNEMILAQETILEGGPVLPWFLISEEARIRATVNEHRVEVPTDFIREVDDGRHPLYYIPVDGGGARTRLTKKSYDDLINWYGFNAQGAPEAYALRGEYFILLPEPDQEYDLVLPGYYARQPAPADSSTSENKWMKWAADVLLAQTGKIVAGQHIKDDTGLVQMFEAEIARGWTRLSVMETAREEANTDRSMG